MADKNFPGSVVVSLRTAGHDIVWARKQIPGASDEYWLGFAQQEKRVLLTLDKDFGELAFARGLCTTCRVVLFRLAPLSYPSQLERFNSFLLAGHELAGRFTIVDAFQARTRELT